MTNIDHTRNCVLPSDGKTEGLIRASELFAVAAERDALRADNERLRAALEWIAETTLTQPGLMVEKARAALEGRT